MMGPTHLQPLRLATSFSTLARPILFPGLLDPFTLVFQAKEGTNPGNVFVIPITGQDSSPGKPIRVNEIAGVIGIDIAGTPAMIYDASVGMVALVPIKTSTGSELHLIDFDPTLLGWQVRFNVTVASSNVPDAWTRTEPRLAFVRSSGDKTVAGGWINNGVMNTFEATIQVGVLPKIVTGATLGAITQTGTNREDFQFLLTKDSERAAIWWRAADGTVGVDGTQTATGMSSTLGPLVNSNLASLKGANILLWATEPANPPVPMINFAGFLCSDVGACTFQKPPKGDPSAGSFPNVAALTALLNGGTDISAVTAVAHDPEGDEFVYLSAVMNFGSTPNDSFPGAVQFPRIQKLEADKRFGALFRNPAVMVNPINSHVLAAWVESNTNGTATIALQQYETKICQ
jgi:hypothetical protein